ncbi:MAG: hypothetical protein P9M13_00870 [Candidatus Ancaeobacter aquaticus]|nr:hypothetical protein [Candidatus Ancaeobacter aquaticus]
MNSRCVMKMIIGSAIFGLVFSVLFHLLALDSFTEYDIDKELSKFKGQITYTVPDVLDQYYLKYKSSDLHASEDVKIYINDRLVENLRSKTGNGVLDLRVLLPVGMVKPGVNRVRVLKNNKEEYAAVDRLTLKNSRRKAVQSNLFILFKLSPLIPRNIESILQGSLWGWLIGFLVLMLASVFSLKVLSYSGLPKEKLISIDLWTYVFPIVVLSSLFISSFFTKYYLVLTSQFFWFIVIFFSVLSKIVIYILTAYRKAFVSGVVLICKKVVHNPVNAMIIIGLILILLIPLPSLIYPYFPITDSHLLAARDAEIFANIAYVLLLIGAILKFIKDYRKFKKEKTITDK